MNNLTHPGGGPEKRALFKVFLSMKLMCTFLLLFQLQAFSEVNAQKTVSLKEKSISLAELLEKLEKQSEYRFVYNENELLKNSVVDISVSNEPVEKVLSRTFSKKGISYSVLENNLIVINNAAKRQLLSGKVLDENGAPIPGVSIRVENANRGTVSNAQGEYELEVNSDEVLIFSYVGYLTERITFNGQTPLNTTLKLSAEGLDEVVVVGYGTQKKVNLTGSVATVKTEDLNRQPVGQASQALQGLSPGLTVTTNSGQPGRDQGTLRIRGIGTLNDESPLILVDGIRYDNSISLNDIDADDIENISVLKDAAAASIYGVRAANGVILVTTKRGATGKTQVSYGNYFGWQDAIRTPDYVGARDFMTLVNQMYANVGRTPEYSQERIGAYDDPNRDPIAHPDNYWFGDILQGSGFQQKHSLSLAGGSDKTKYRLSTNYFDQKGLIKNMDFERLTVRLNTDFKISDQLDLNADISGRFSQRDELQASDGSAWFQFGQANRINPLQSAKDENGNWRALRGENNVLRLQEEGGIFGNNDRLITSNFRLNYRPAEGLVLSAIASNNFQNQYISNHTKEFNYVNSSAPLGRNEITKTSIGYTNQNYQALAEYGKVTGDHDFKALAGASYLAQKTDSLSATRVNLPNGDLKEINAGAEDGQLAFGTAREYTLISFFGRINYAYKGKYLLEANIRRDGSSRFSDTQRWGWFPSASVGWRLSEESFMDNVSFVQDLKIRGSYGRLGNDAIGDYPYQSPYILNSYPFGGILNQTAGLNLYPSMGLTWETTDVANIGLDFTVGRKLTVNFDYFDKRTRDILLRLPIPSYVGLEPNYQNAAVVKNRGWELALNYNEQIGDDFKFDIGFNLSDVRNELIDLRGTDFNSTDGNGVNRGNYVGRPIGAFYGYVADGIYQTADQVAASPVISGTVAPGDLIYRDLNNDGVFDNVSDFVFLGSDIPRYNFGLTLGATYKHFDFNAFFQGVGKVDINTLNLERAPINTDGNFRSAWLNAWTPENTSSDYPRLATYQNNYQPSSFWIQNGSYIRLKNLQIGYRVPKAVLSGTFVNNLRIFASGQNLFTITGLPKDLDPESPNDNRYYPQVRTLTFGLNANF